MTFQILNLVIYSYRGEIREVDFRAGELNIITGESGAGKTVLIPLMDYCFGDSESNISEGAVTQKVEWVGLRLRVASGEIFIARRLPPIGAKSSTDVYYKSGKTVSVPPYSELVQNTNPDGLESLLTAHAGIEVNVHEPLAGQSRDPVAATIRHALWYCFQHQTVIANNQLLFHGQQGQKASFKAQSMKDTLPYFLGAVPEDTVEKLGRLRDLNRELRLLERRLLEADSVVGAGLSKAAALVSEATDAGLREAAPLPESWNQTVALLQEIYTQPMPSEELIVSREGDEFERLQTERQQLETDFRKIKSQLAAARDLDSNRTYASRETQAQLNRLRSIDFFSVDSAGDELCPLCNSTVEPQLPKIAELKKASEDVQSRIRTVEERSPELQKAIISLEQKLRTAQNALQANRQALEQVAATSHQIQNYREHVARRANILGRISLYLESLPAVEETSGMKSQVAVLRQKIKKLESELSRENTQERVDSCLRVISQDMTEYAKRLDHEYAPKPFSLDIKNLTVVADGDEGPVPMHRMGSGENWVGVHVIAHLALHRFFVKRNRPVPHFLLLDQPSQAYFPEDSDWDAPDRATDREKVSRMIRLVWDVVSELAPGFQVIVTEHANINEDWFQQSIRHRWRGGVKLVPDDWQPRSKLAPGTEQKPSEDE